MPTVTLGDRSGTDYAGTQDAMLYSAGPNANYSSEAASGASGPILLRFTGLTSITGPVTVSDAYLTLYRAAGGASGSASVYRVLRTWVEAQATWNEWATSSSWTTAGCDSAGNDRASAASATLTQVSSFDTGDFSSTSNTTLIADVEGIINGTLSNDGWILPAFSGISYGLPANTTAAFRPLLTVTYTSGGGVSLQPTTGALAIAGQTPTLQQLSYQVLLADADVTTTNWSPSTGTTLYECVDESPPNDSDWISTDTLNAECEISLASGAVPGAAGHRHVRIYFPTGFTPVGALDVTLREGAGTTVQTWTGQTITAGGYLELAVTGSITDYTDLRLRLKSVA